MRKICVYTCITGDYDNLQEIKNKEPGVDYYCFTNNKNIKSDSWNVVYIQDEKIDNTRLARKIKILGHPIIMDKYDISIWVDGFISEMNVFDFLHEQCDLDSYDFICFKHSQRDCIYEEAEECIRQGKDDPSLIREEMKFLRKKGYPRNNGLIESTVLIRKHNNPKVKKTMKIWFDMVAKYSKRDQLSLNYAIYETGIDVQCLNINVFDNKYFKFAKHNGITLDKLYTVYYDIGNGYNEKNRNDLLYLHSKDNLIIRLKLKFDVYGLRIDLCEMQGVVLTIKELKNIEFNDINFIDWLNVGDEYISLKDPQLIINHSYRKNEEIYLIINLQKPNDSLLYDTMYNTIKNLNDELVRQKYELSELKTINKKINRKYQSLIEKYDQINKNLFLKVTGKICRSKGEKNDKK